jgi:nucleotide-binding universal stress UspA family protein
MRPLEILVPTDFSDTSLKAFEIAAMFAKMTKGHVTPFHSYIPLSEIDGYFYMGLGVTAQLGNADLDKMLLGRLDEIAETYIPSQYRKPAKLGVGNAANAITHVSDDYDLIVMGSHGRSGVSRFIMGSVTEKVLRMVKSPVLVVRENTTLTEVKSILMPLDLSLNSLSAISFVRNMMGDGETRLHLLHVITTDEYNDDKNARIQAGLQEGNLKSIVHAHLSEYSSRITFSSVVTRNPAYEEVVNFAKAGAYDMIAMTRVGKSALSYLTLGSTTANVIRASEIPVLSMRPPSAD